MELSYFGQGVSSSISIQSWKIGCGKLNSISGSSTVCWLLHTLAGLSTFGHNFVRCDGNALAPRSTSNATTLWFASWNLDTSIYWLSISPSWLLLIIHGIGNLTKTFYLVHWLENLSGTLHLYSLYRRTTSVGWLRGFGHWDIGHFIWWCRWVTNNLNQSGLLYLVPFHLSHSHKVVLFVTNSY